MKETYLKLSLISFIISTFLLIPSALAVDIPVETYVEGALTISINGAWETGTPFSSVMGSVPYSQTSYWNHNQSTDYITFADDTTTTGFYLLFNLENFQYTGSHPTQDSISASNLTLFAQYSGSTASAATKGNDDPSLTLSILPNSCSTASASDYTFYENFTSASATYSLPGSTSNQIILTSTGDCLNIGHLRFDRMEVNMPTDTASGSYGSRITFTIVDGAP